MFVLVIEILLIVLTYILSSSWLTAGVASIITIVGYMLLIDNNPFSKAANVFYVACTAGLIYLFGIYANNLANGISGEYFVELKICLQNIGKVFTDGATPPFNITGDGPSDLTIFIFGFAILEIVLQSISSYCRRK